MESSSSSSFIAATLRSTLSKLSQPITDVDDLVETLKAPLDALGISPPLQKPLVSELQPERRSTAPSPQTIRLVASIQNAILTNVVPSWDTPLHEQGHDFALNIIEQYFCPRLSPQSTTVSKAAPSSSTTYEIALSAYSVLLASTDKMPLFSLRILSRLLEEFSVESMYTCLFLGADGTRKGDDEARRMLDWEQFVKVAGSLASRVANATEGKQEGVPINLRTK